MSYDRIKKIRTINKLIERENAEKAILDNLKKKKKKPENSCSLGSDEKTVNDESLIEEMNEKLLEELNNSSLDVQSSDLLNDVDDEDFDPEVNLDDLLLVEDGENEESSEPPSTMKEKLVAFALKHAKTLQHNVLTDLLKLLRSEGYVNLPKTAQTLLGTKNFQGVRPMLSKKGTLGRYAYIGIENQFKKRISPDVFTDETIEAFVNIDGVQVYRSSNKQFWPILMQIRSKNFECNPFVIGIYLGNSKPHTAAEFLEDFISEARMLITNGVIISGKKYKFRIRALICDSPARSYLKCIKSHGGFSACERCTVHGVTVNGKRVYPELDCPKRTKRSFELEKDKNHHLPGQLTPLLQLPEFNVIRCVPIDSMHLLFMGVMKWLLEKWNSRSSPFRIKKSKERVFKELMASLEKMVPAEFQRKVFDPEEIARWKATQYRFILLYCGPVIFSHVLSPHQYKHFLLLSMACRILCDPKHVLTSADYANDLLRKFVMLTPSLYGSDSQIMNIHNLIHIADDVKHFQLPLTEISAFWAENYLGKLKHLVRTPKNPLAQVVNRLSEQDPCPEEKVKKRDVIQKIVIKNSEITEVRMNGMVISYMPPNNVVQLKNGKIMFVSNILTKNSEDGRKSRAEELFLTGSLVKSAQNIFSEPDVSNKFGFLEILEISNDTVTLPLESVELKCVFLTIDKKLYSITLLHVHSG